MIRIVKSDFIKSAVLPEHYVHNSFRDIAFVGKSNVGKSSLINTLLNRKQIAKISGTPGKTKVINFYKVEFRTKDEFEGWVNFVDLPGYGYAKVSKKDRNSWEKMIELYFQQRIELKGVVLLIDIRHDKDVKDELMLNMLIQYKIPYILVATKSDKIGKTKINAQMKKLLQSYQILAEKMIPVSSKSKTGMPQLIQWIEDQLL